MKLPSLHGRRKYRCTDCSAEEFVHKRELSRAARLRCSSCGSTRLEPVTKEGRNDVLDRATAAELGPTGSMVRSSDSSLRPRLPNNRKP
jgi:DNA-directed RNA polymerase subunit RPC12/RpoP